MASQMGESRGMKMKCDSGESDGCVSSSEVPGHIVVFQNFLGLFKARSINRNLNIAPNSNTSIMF